MRTFLVLSTLACSSAMLVWTADVNGTTFTTGNLLSNPGGESGVAAPWGLNGEPLQSTPASLSTGTISASEGTYWFKAQQSYTLSGPTTISGGGGALGQFFDVTAFPNPQSITVGGDFFGVGQVTAGAGSVFQTSMLRVLFYSPSFATLGDVFVNVPAFNIGSPAILDDFRSTIAVPAGTAQISFNVYNSFKFAITSSGTAHADGILGSDDFYASLTYVPEPSAIVLGGLGIVGLVVACTRNKRQIGAGNAAAGNR